MKHFQYSKTEEQLHVSLKFISAVIGPCIVFFSFFKVLVQKISLCGLMLALLALHQS